MLKEGLLSGAEIQTLAVVARTAVWVSTAEKIENFLKAYLKHPDVHKIVLLPIKLRSPPPEKVSILRIFD